MTSGDIIDKIKELSIDDRDKQEIVAALQSTGLTGELKTRLYNILETHREVLNNNLRDIEDVLDVIKKAEEEIGVIETKAQEEIDEIVSISESKLRELNQEAEKAKTIVDDLIKVMEEMRKEELKGAM